MPIVGLRRSFLSGTEDIRSTKFCESKLFLFVMFAGRNVISFVRALAIVGRLRQKLPRLPKKIIKSRGFPQIDGCVSSIRGVCNNFEKFFAMLAGAQNFGSDQGNLVSS
ncbi:MAG: hypothetical protein WCC39_01020 [Telluria sp.]